MCSTTSETHRNRRRDPVHIEVHHGAALVDAAVGDHVVAPLVASVLEYENIKFEQGGKRGYRQTRERVPLYDLDFKDRLAFPTGLVPAVKDALEKHGYQVHVTDHREFAKRFAVDEEVLRSSNGEDRRLLEAVKQHPLGQIDVRNGSDMLDCMRLVILLFPQAHVLIPVAQRKYAWYLWNRLNERAIDFDVDLKTKPWSAKPPRCLVTTYQPLASCDPEDWDIILLPDPLRAMQERFAGVLADVTLKYPYRCYSFVGPGQQFGRRGRARLEAISGRSIYTADPGKPAVRVLWLKTPTCTNTGGEEEPLAWKRKAYWYNSRRNEYIAAVARAFVEKKSEKLQKYGVPFRRGKPVIANPEAPSVVVLVESTEHGRELLRRLEGWEMVDRVPGRKPPANATEVKGTIVTAVTAAKDGLDADVVIRATGSTGARVFQKFPGEFDRNQTAPMLVLDFADEHDDLAKREAHRRRREYELLGWAEVPPCT